MKKMVCLILSICLILSNIGASSVFAADNPTVTVSCKSECNAAEQITVSVDLSDVAADSAYCGLSFGLIYDNAKFAYSSHTAGSIITGLGNVNPKAAENEVYVNYIVTTPKTDNGNIIEVVFDVLSTAEGEAEFTLNDLKLKNISYQNITVDEVYALTDIIPLPKPTAKINIANDTVKAGETVTVEVSLENATNFCGLSFGLVYDNTKFSYVDHTVGSVILGLGNVNPAAAENEIYVNYMNATPVSNNGTLVRVVFKVKDDVKGLSNFIINELKLKNVSYQNIDAISIDNSITILRKDVVTNSRVESNVVVVTPLNAEIGDCIFVTLYQKGKMVFLDSYSYNGETSLSFPFNVEYDKIKIMVWEGSLTLKPLGKAEELYAN